MNSSEKKVESPVKEQTIELFYRIGNLPFVKEIGRAARGDSGILMYHRVLPERELETDTAGLAISAKNFEAHLQLLTDKYSPVSLTEFITGIKTKKFPVVLTFDDGYRDNLDVALPLLKKYNVPATFYITTRFADGDTSMWWYELTPLLQAVKDLQFSWKTKTVDLKILNSKSEKNAYKFLRGLFVNSTPAEQNELLSIIKAKAKIDSANPQVLSWDELRMMSRDPLVTIGSHTVNHPVLSQLGSDELSEELTGSKRKLESHLGTTVDHFAYPFGTASEAGSREYSAARIAGYQSAVVTENSPLKRDSTNPFALPRIAVKRRTTAKHLQAKLEGWNHLWGGLQI